MTTYLDTSAAVKLLVTETESDILRRHLDGLDPQTDLVSSLVLETELRRFAARVSLRQREVTRVLELIGLVEPSRSVFAEAGLLPGVALRSLDALHLATALRIEAEVVLAYDRRMLSAADALGLRTASPGAAGSTPHE